MSESNILKFKHCCDIMEGHAEKNRLIHFDKTFKSYDVYVDSSYGTVQVIYYCPWCGIKLPEDLEEKWSKILTEEYNVEYPGFTSEVPPEFKTDEWWKKRGL